MRIYHGSFIGRAKGILPSGESMINLSTTGMTRMERYDIRRRASRYIHCKPLLLLWVGRDP